MLLFAGEKWLSDISAKKNFFFKNRVDLYTKMYKIKFWEIFIINIDHHELPKKSNSRKKVFFGKFF